MTIIFFSKSSKFDVDSRNGSKRSEKFLVLKKIAFESGKTNSYNPEQDTSHWQSMCYKTSLRFNISLRGIFFKSGSLRVIKKSVENPLTKTLQEFGTL